jgi:hypothetical protein
MVNAKCLIRMPNAECLKHNEECRIKPDFHFLASGQEGGAKGRDGQVLRSRISTASAPMPMTIRAISL